MAWLAAGKRKGAQLCRTDMLTSIRRIACFVDVRAVDQSRSQREYGELCARARAGLSHGGCDVTLHGPGRDMESFRDLGVGRSFDDKSYDAKFSRCEMGVSRSRAHGEKFQRVMGWRLATLGRKRSTPVSGRQSWRAARRSPSPPQRKASAIRSIPIPA